MFFFLEDVNKYELHPNQYLIFDIFNDLKERIKVSETFQINLLILKMLLLLLTFILQILKNFNFEKFIFNIQYLIFLMN